MPTDENRKKELFQEFLKNKKNLQIRNQLVEIYYPLVNKIVSKFKYFPSILQRQDLFQEGVLGLINALEGYDFQVDIDQFIYYASKNIKSHIRGLIKKCHQTAMPRQNNKKINKVDFEEWEEATQPKWSKILTPHQLWLKQAHHDIFVLILTKNLTPKQFDVIKLSLGISAKDVEDNNKFIRSTEEIAEELKKKYNENFSPRQVFKLRENGIIKLQKIFKKRRK
ncbi:DNA-directed RNA polymerase specialized sigma subunit [Candidatus Phytoplasma australiense]|uniref:DNA-directed RNA polymerase specialized sigma subunit n=1 Tax=Phytoplasma australiense TaxID=59748 RepID=B1VB26_PHYAS|nr:DNA-directed RNA polymerase specialized sigma subunit [Candidatus Phytoplasma australiense]